MSDKRPPSWFQSAGHAATGLAALVLLGSAVAKLIKHQAVLGELGGKLGYPEATIQPIGALEVAIAVLLVVPRTSILGALLVTAYLGGATAAHVRVGDPFVVPVLLGVVVWAGMWMRDARVRALVPLRSAP